MALGIDIGSHSIKVVELEQEKNRWRLISAGIAQAPAPGIISENERDLVAVAQAIKKLTSDAKISEKKAVVSLPESKVYTRLVLFPPLSDQEIASAIGWQIEGYIPIARKDAIYDHQVVQKTDRGVEVLVVAVPKTVVSKYMKILELSEFIPLAIETELLALARSVALPQKRCLVVDIGATSTDVAVVVNQQLMFSRSIPTAGQALTRAISVGIGVEHQQAEQYKQTYGLTPELQGKVKQALDPIVAVLVDEIKKAIGFWKEDHASSPIDTVLLSGGTAGLPALVPLLSGALGSEVIIGNPFANVVLDPNSSKALTPYATLYSIAVGLAMRQV